MNTEAPDVRKLSLRLMHLSQEHRAAMLLVAAAREVVPADPDQDTDLPRFGRKVHEIFLKEMEPHFQEEEKYAVPKLRAIGRDDLADEVLAQHAELRELIEGIDRPNAETVQQLSHLLQKHVDFEENVVWEALDATKPETVPGL